MGRIKNTFALARTSWGVLQQDRELLWIPVLSFLTSILVAAVLVTPALLTLETTQTATGESTTISAVGGFFLLLAALALGVVSVFFTGALVAGAHERMSGGDPTVRSAISTAFGRIAGLVPWALLTTTVGMIIRALRERAGFLGQMLLGGINMAWEVAAFLTIPAIVIDNKGPIDGFKTSAGLLRSTWGENLAARVGFGLVGFLLVIPAVVLGGLLVASGSAALAVVGIVIAVAWIALSVVVMTALGAIFQTALYMYATTGTSPGGFESTTLSQSFARR